LTGGPDWIRETQYDIEAKTEDGAIAPGTSGRARDDKIRLMLQTLLAERFKMVMRREIKELPVYAVVVRKGGPKMQKADIDEKACASRPTNFAEVDSCHSFQGGQGRGLHGQAISVADVRRQLFFWVDDNYFSLSTTTTF